MARRRGRRSVMTMLPSEIWLPAISPLTSSPNNCLAHRPAKCKRPSSAFDFPAARQGNEKPPATASQGACRPQVCCPQVLRRSATGVSADHLAEQFPPLALEALEPERTDGRVVTRSGVDPDAGQQ